MNNIQYLRYAETSRVHFFHRLMFTKVPRERQAAWAELYGPRSESLIMKSATVEFLLVGFPLACFRSYEIRVFLMSSRGSPLSTQTV